MEALKDIFDQLEEEDSDIFDEIDQEESSVEKLKEELTKTLISFDNRDNKKERASIVIELKQFIEQEISKIKPKQNVIERIIEKKIIEPKVIHLEPKVIEAPPQIIKEVRVEVQTEKKDKTKYVEESKYLDLLIKVGKLEAKLKETTRMAEFPLVMGGSGVIGIPPPEPSPVGYVLTINDKKKAEWKVATASGGGSSSDVYTTANVTTTRSLDPTSSSIDDLYNTLASLIVSLQGAGIIQ